MDDIERDGAMACRADRSADLQAILRGYTCSRTSLVCVLLRLRTAVAKTNLVHKRLLLMQAHGRVLKEANGSPRTALADIVASRVNVFGIAIELLAESSSTRGITWQPNRFVHIVTSGHAVNNVYYEVLSISGSDQYKTSR